MPPWNVNMQQLLQSLGTSAAQAGTNQLVTRLLGQRLPAQPSSWSFGLPQLAGLGLTAAGVLGDKESGDVTEARQFLRNRFTSPTALTDQFTGQVGALKAQYQPLLDQQRTRDIEGISQRFAAAFPHQVGAQGPEFGTLARYITDEALPREQAVMGDLGRYFTEQQGNAASTILSTSKPDALSQLAAILGYSALTNNGAGGMTGLTGMTSAGVPGVTQAPGSPSGVQPSPQQILAQGGAQTGATATGQLAGLGSWLGALGSGAAGYGLGNVIGHAVQTPTSTGESWQAGVGGAAAGAVSGALIGALTPLGPAGALIGGLAGLFGGLQSQHAESLAIKAGRHAADLQASGSNINITGSFWTGALGAAGTDTDSFKGWIDSLTAGYGGGDKAFSFGGVSGTNHPQDAIAKVGSHLLLQEIQKTQPSITNLDQVPGFRDQYIAYLMQHYRIEREGGISPVSNVSQFGGLVTDAGLSY